MKRKLALLISLSPILLLSGCMEGGGGLDFVKITQEPIVVIVGALVIAFWMFKRGK